MSRRFAAVGMNRRVGSRFSLVNVPPPTKLLEITDGTFTRASVGNATVVPNVVESAVDVLRTRDLGNGADALFEGSHTNLCLRSEEFDNATWTKALASITADDADSPVGSGDKTADLLTNDGTSGQHYILQSITTTAAPHTFTVFAKKPATNAANYLLIRTTGPNSGVAWDMDDASIVFNLANDHASGFVVGDDWICADMTTTMTSGASQFRIIITDAVPAAINPSETSSSEALIWGASCAAADYPRTYVETTSTSATMAADTLTFATYSASLNSGVFSFSIWPSFASGEQSAEQVILSYGGADDELRLSTGNQFIVRDGASNIITATAGTWSRHQKITLTLDAVSGSITTEGMTTGNGTSGSTAWTWPASTLRIGGRVSSANEFFGRVGDIFDAS